MRRMALLVALAVLAGCGGGSKVDTLYSGGEWVVDLNKGKAEVQHHVNGKWVVDSSGSVKIDILGPKPGETLTGNPPQVAISMHSTAPLVESALWIDDLRIFEKGGGSPTNGTIYGAPANPLDPGMHIAVGYARTATTGTAVAWVFQAPKNG